MEIEDITDSSYGSVGSYGSFGSDFLCDIETEGGNNLVVEKREEFTSHVKKTRSLGWQKQLEKLAKIEELGSDTARQGNKKIQFGSSEYVGQVDQNNQLEGRGVMTFADGSFYNGCWERSMRNGIGFFYNNSQSRPKTSISTAGAGEPSISIDEVAVRSNSISGSLDSLASLRSARLTQSKGGAGDYTYIIYHGDYVNGKKNGYGVQCYRNGDVYQGEWVNGNREGWGILHSMNLAYHYEGQWKGDLKSDSGIFFDHQRHRTLLEIWQSGNRLCYADLADSSSVFNSPEWVSIRNGDTALFKANVLSENPKWTSQYLIELCGGIKIKKEIIFDFGKYIGEVRQNTEDSKGKEEINGNGIMIFNDGSHYDGEWRNNHRHGLGTFFYSDGTSYHGEYKFNKKNGFGIQTYANGETYSGNWVEGCRHGWGIQRNTSGCLVEGEFKDDRKVGIGVQRDTSFSLGNGSHYFVLEVRNDAGTLLGSKIFFFSDPACSKPIWKTVLEGNSTILQSQIEKGEFFVSEWMNSSQNRRSSVVGMADVPLISDSLMFLNHPERKLISNNSVPAATSSGHNLAIFGNIKDSVATDSPRFLDRSRMSAELTHSGGFASPSQILLKQGYLNKLKRNKKKWNKRYFILKQNATLLYYNKDPGASGISPSGYIELRQYAIRLLDGNDLKEIGDKKITRQEYVFELWHPEKRSYQLAAKLESERADWVFALKRFCLK